MTSGWTGPRAWSNQETKSGFIIAASFLHVQLQCITSCNVVLCCAWCQVVVHAGWLLEGSGWGIPLETKHIAFTLLIHDAGHGTTWSSTPMPSWASSTAIAWSQEKGWGCMCSGTSSQPSSGSSPCLRPGRGVEITWQRSATLLSGISITSGQPLPGHTQPHSSSSSMSSLRSWTL